MEQSRRGAGWKTGLISSFMLTLGCSCSLKHSIHGAGSTFSSLSTKLFIGTCLCREGVMGNCKLKSGRCAHSPNPNALCAEQADHHHHQVGRRDRNDKGEEEKERQEAQRKME